MCYPIKQKKPQTFRPDCFPVHRSPSHEETTVKLWNITLFIPDISTTAWNCLQYGNSSKSQSHFSSSSTSHYKALWKTLMLIHPEFFVVSSESGHLHTEQTAIWWTIWILGTPLCHIVSTPCPFLQQSPHCGPGRTRFKKWVTRWMFTFISECSRLA